ncbi:transporter substrate-binding domain-containing protein [Thioclava sp. FTW29]|uniref:Transporter substrate-binding domain-containing protein n=1 Tax=Thioclava litoralis TaxID=3076557 RepID=A0ABZ1E6C3_9RHOB|nr:transporter substrate-binding domain-containing protein [Thioclava sp. FTW29]
MIRKIALTLLVTAGMAIPAMAETLKVGVSAEPYPPFYTPDADGNWSGWEIDLMHEVCKRIDADCVVAPVAWEGIIPALNTGKIDMIMGSMAITAERAKQIAFSDKYYDSPTGILAAKSLDITPDAEGVKGLYIGTQSGSSQENFVNAHLADSASGVRVYQTLDEELQDLAAGRIDAVVGDTLAMQPFIESDEGKACCHYVGAVKGDPETLGRGVGVGVRQKDTELLARVNKAIADIRADGTYDTLSKRYFTIDIYGE